MNVLEIVPSDGLGGVQVNLASRLRHQNSVNTRILVEKHESENQVPFRTELIASPMSVNRLNSLYNAIRDEHRRKKIDVILSHSPRSAIHLALLTKGRLLPAPFIVVIHNTELSPRVPFYLRSRYYQFLASSFSYAEGVLAVSNEVARTVLCAKARKLEVSLLGAERPPFRPLRNAFAPGGASAFTILAVGRFTPAKNFDALIKATQSASDDLQRSVKLRIVGYGHKPGYESDAQRSDQLFCLEITDRVDNAWQDVDAFAISSRHEGGPLTLYEALQLGLPVASTPVGAAPEILDTDTNSFLAEDVSLQSLHLVIRKLLTQGRLSESLRTQRAERFDFLNIQHKAPDFYSRVVDLLS